MISKVRNGGYIPFFVIERKRSEAALIQVVSGGLCAYAYQGDNPKALEWYPKTLAIREKVLGMEQLPTAAIYNNIAEVYESQSDYSKALVWFQKVMAVVEVRLGINHPYTKSVQESIRRLKH